MKAANTAARPQATRQSLVQKPVEDKPIEYMAGGSKVEMSIALTQAYFCDKASPAEAFVFNQWCAHLGLDPWKKECYLVKFGSEPATMITSVDVYKKRAEKNPNYRGRKSGIIVQTADGKLEERLGTILLDGENLVGGWCDVQVKDYIDPISARVSFKEYCRYKSDGKPMAQWADRPATMIEKVAVTHALRDAFPNDFGSMYIAEEMGMEEPAQNSGPIIKKEEAADGVFVPVDEETGEVLDDDEMQASFFGEE